MFESDDYNTYIPIIVREIIKQNEFVPSEDIVKVGTFKPKEGFSGFIMNNGSGIHDIGKQINEFQFISNETTAEEKSIVPFIRYPDKTKIVVEEGQSPLDHIDKTLESQKTLKRLTLAANTASEFQGTMGKRLNEFMNQWREDYAAGSNQVHFILCQRGVHIVADGRMLISKGQINSRSY